MPAQDTMKLYGPPGTGKTYQGMRWLVHHVERGVDPRGVAFCSFTNAACDEARNRVCDRFGVEPGEVPYCATLHALAKRSLAIEQKDWLADDHLEEFAEACRYDIKPPKKSGPADQDDMGALAQAQGADAPLLAVWHWTRNRLLLDQAEGMRGYASYDPDGALLIPFPRYEKFVSDYEGWKRERGFLDYTDLLLRAMERGARVPATLAIVDEAQDMTPLLWAVADALFGEVPLRATLGDDDQAIYSFQGADPALMNDRAAEKVYKLERSHRLPRAIAELAQRVIGRNQNRTEKSIRPRDEDGGVLRVRGIRELPLDNGKSWFVLIRNWKFFREVTEAIEGLGIPYRVQGGRKYSPWSEKGPLRAYRAFRQLGDGRRVALSELRALVDRTGSATAARAGVWAWGAKGQLADLAKRAPGATVSLMELPRYGLTETGFDAILDGDASVLAGHLSDRDLTAYLEAEARGHFNDGAPTVRVEVSSIHGKKGAEADCVAAYASCTGAVMRSLTRPLRREEENRLAYVAITRAREQFFAVNGNTVGGAFPYAVFGV